MFNQFEYFDNVQKLVHHFYTVKWLNHKEVY